MRKHLLITGIALLFVGQANSQIQLQWNSAFSPSWSNGALNRTASNISGYSIHCTTVVTMTGPGSFAKAMGNSGAQTPTVSGAVFTIPGSSSRLQVTTNYNQKSSYTDIVFSFTSMVTNVSFRVVDIDKNDAFSSTYFDRVTISGSNGSSSFNPVISKYDPVTDPDFLIISGNSAWVNTSNGQAGNTASDGTDQRGTIDVSFGSAVINSLSIRYDNDPASNNNPANQAIAIGEINFNQSVLPVTLLDFSGHRQNRDIVLDWTTIQELQLAGFGIERKSTGDWQLIGQVEAAGISNRSAHYSFTDRNPAGEILLYRLRQTDLDNHYKYSPVVRIMDGIKTGDLKIFPNPFKEQIGITTYSRQKQIFSITLTDAGGNTVLSENRTVFPGVNNLMLSVSPALPKGIYRVVLRDENDRITGSANILRE